MEISSDIVWAIIDILIMALFGLIAGVYWTLYHHNGEIRAFQTDIDTLKTTCTEIKGNIRSLDEKLERYWMFIVDQTRNPEFIAKLKATALKGGNPYDPNRRNELLDKYQKGNLTIEEGQELQKYLQEDAAASSGAALVLIILAIIGIGAFLALLSQATGKK